MRPRELFTHVARVETASWTLLILTAVLTVALSAGLMGLKVAGLLHLLVALAYVAVVLALWANHRWRSTILGRALLAGVVPFGTLWFARWARRRRELSGDWRLGRNGSYAYSPQERTLAWVLRHPTSAAFTGAAVVLATGALWWLAFPVR
jgi:integral membrane protein